MENNILIKICENATKSLCSLMDKLLMEARKNEGEKFTLDPCAANCIGGLINVLPRKSKRKIDSPYEPSPVRYIITTPIVASFLTGKNGFDGNIWSLEDCGMLEEYSVYSYALYKLSPSPLIVVEDTDDGWKIIKYITVDLGVEHD